MGMVNEESFSIATGKYDSTGHLQFTLLPNQAFINSVYFTQLGAADWDNDGDVDLIPNIHYVYEFHTVLTENNHGVFADTAVRFKPPLPPLMTNQFHDFNLDGFVDAFFSQNGKTYIRDGKSGALVLLPMTPNGTVGNAGLTLLDINRDGWMDVLSSKVVNSKSEVYLFLGKSDFGFEPERLLYLRQGSPQTNVGDFDGDNIGDFLSVAPYPSKDTVIIHTKLLSGTPVSQALRIPKASKIFYPDVNDDGLTDLVFGLNDTFHLRLNLGNGQFGAHHFLMRTNDENTSSVHPFPVGAGKDFFAGYYSLKIRYNFHFQNGVFAVTASENVFTNGIALDDNYANSCLADLDGDGNRLVLGMWNNRGIAIASLRDSAKDTRILYRDFHGAAITALESADFDRDGRDELVFFDRAGALQTGKMDSTGAFAVQAPLLVDDALRNTFVIKVGDFDQNGYPDLLYGNSPKDEIILMANQNGRDFVRHVVIDSFSLFSARVTDYNNDGLPDVLIQPKIRPNTNSAAFIFQNQGNLKFSKTTYWTNGYWGESPEDGPLGKIIVLKSSMELSLSEITPNGFKTIASIMLAKNPTEYALLDYNRDSLPDIYYNSNPGKAGYICLNRGDGTFTPDAVLVPHIELNKVFDLEKDGIPEFLAISRRDWMWGTAIPTVVSKTAEPAIVYDLTLWPSPAREFLNIRESADGSIESVDIYTLSGILCKRMQGPISDWRIPVGNLAAGTYILVARYAKGVERMGRFVKM